MSGLVGLVRRARQESPRQLAQRVVRRAQQRLDTAALDFPLLPGDVADSTRIDRARPPVRTDGGPLRVGWLSTPPAAGSGGHTTMFRMVRALEAAGHRCVVLLYQRHGGDTAAQARVIREAWPWVSPEIRPVEGGFVDLDAVIATGWETAHVLASRVPPDLHRLYFIQDYEPFFYPHGSEYELAADTYRFGFTNIALGHMVRDRLRAELGVDPKLVPFSCDTSVYRLLRPGPRTGVVWYAKPGAARRGYRLAALALTEFHRRRPEQEIHVYGEHVSDIPVPVVHHGRLSPEQLNELYNSCAAGFAMSFTNVSLVAEEMLAAGCLPVVNDAPDVRADLDHPYVAWATATPGGLADALTDAVERSADGGVAAAAAANVRRDDWTRPGADLVRIVEDTVRTGAGALSSPTAWSSAGS